jgi:hypothetical protein
MSILSAGSISLDSTFSQPVSYSYNSWSCILFHMKTYKLINILERNGSWIFFLKSVETGEKMSDISELDIQEKLFNILTCFKEINEK